MFKKELEKRIKKIFGIKKVTYDAPSEEFEQDCIFIEIHPETRTRVTDTKQMAEVRGAIVIFSKGESLPYGFVVKKLKRASQEDLAGLMFFDIDTEVLSSQARFVNIHERRSNFIFLYSGQYDPRKNKLTGFQCED